MTPTGEIVSEILARLDYAVFERSGNGRFEIQGTPPAWLDAFFGARGDPGENSLFLADFLEQAAADCWSSELAGEPERSGIWEETNALGESRHFEAIAMTVGEAAVLIIESADERHDREQMFVQQWHVDTLDRRRLGKEIEKKEILLDCIVHDLSSPLSTIMINLQHLGRKTGDVKLRKSIERALGQAERQRDMIRSIAEVFRSDLTALDPLSLNRESAPDIQKVAVGIVDGYREVAEGRGVELTIANQIPVDAENPRQVIAESSHLARVLENLVTNALRHSEEGGRVTVILEDDPDQDSVVARVEDEGPGVDPNIADTLFQPFVQGARGGGQSGLGLYFCKMMVQLWGGEIGYRLRPEGGACFWFRLRNFSPAEIE